MFSLLSNENMPSTARTLVVADAETPEEAGDEGEGQGDDGRAEGQPRGQAERQGAAKHVADRNERAEGQRNDEHENALHQPVVDGDGIAHHFAPSVGEDVDHLGCLHRPEAHGRAQ